MLQTESLLVKKKNGEILTQAEAEEFFGLAEKIYKLEQDNFSLNNYKSKCTMLQIEIEAQVRMFSDSLVTCQLRTTADSCRFEHLECRTGLASTESGGGEQ